MSTPFALEMPADVDHLADARRQVRRWLADEGIDPVTAVDLLAVASEFLLHAIVRSGGHGAVRLEGERGPRGVRLAVRADAAEDGVRRLRLPEDPLAAGGIGRRMVEECCDDLRVGTDTATASAECWRGVA